MKKFFKEFKEFAIEGNMLSLAVGVLIGASFQGLITSLTDNIISPLLGIFVNQNFDYLYIEIAGATLTYGAFVTSLINFLIMALLIFTIIRAANRLLKRKSDDEGKDNEN
ncbi:MAG: large conductance mechanosensitive channel protein MscL [Defluviitaleaceae bacterium]|nr:large conductance mechanosensitive channel protein MscL [Defluviitaleaceae bacterium]